MARINELVNTLANRGSGVIGNDMLMAIANQLAPEVSREDLGYMGETGAGSPVYSGFVGGSLLDRLAPYDFSWQDTGTGNTGTLTATKGGLPAGQWSQTDSTFGEDLANWGALMGAAFGGLGMAGAGPLAGALGGGAAGSIGAAGSVAAPTFGELTALLPGSIPSGGMVGAGLAGAGLAGGALPLAAPTAGQMSALLPGAIPAASGGGNMLTSIFPSLGGAVGSLSNRDLLGIGGNLLGGYMQSRAAGKVADAQMGAIDKSNDLLRYFYDTARSDNAPLREATYEGLAGYRNLLKNPGSIADDPGYQFQLNEGMKALDSTAASRGGLYSGAQLKRAQRYGQDYASTKVNDVLGRYGTLAGLGQPGLSATTAAGQNTAGALSNNALTAGNVRGSQFVGKSNAWSDAINGLMDNMQGNEINALLRRRLGT